MGGGGPWQPLELFPSLELQLEKHHPGKGINSKVTCVLYGKVTCLLDKGSEGLRLGEEEEAMPGVGVGSRGCSPAGPCASSVL